MVMKNSGELVSDDILTEMMIAVPAFLVRAQVPQSRTLSNQTIQLVSDVLLVRRNVGKPVHKFQIGWTWPRSPSGLSCTVSYLIHSDCTLSHKLKDIWRNNGKSWCRSEMWELNFHDNMLIQYMLIYRLLAVVVFCACTFILTSRSQGGSSDNTINCMDKTKVAEPNLAHGTVSSCRGIWQHARAACPVVKGC